MLASLLSFVFAVIGLGFLIFIHELGHYWMARRTGMKVESFGIGFGKPIYSFEHNGVKWNLCWIPFGGYVKIAGMEKEKNGREPYDIPNGFFGKSPWARIKVSIMGPLANLIFAMLVFCILWATGGREKNFSDVTKRIGWVDPQSELYRNGVRPGDEILSYDNKNVRGSKDHLQAAMIGGETVHVEGRRYDRTAKNFVPFTMDVHPYPHPLAAEKGVLTTGVLAPASYVIFSKTVNGAPNTLPKGSPLENSGIQFGDRIVAIDGERIYSLAELSTVLNDGRALVTIRRGKELFLRRVPRVLVEELKLDKQQQEELTDWQWEAHLTSTKLGKLYFIPYNLASDGVVEGRLTFIDQDKTALAFPKLLLSDKEEPLLVGDQIIAIDGMPIQSPVQLIEGLQERKIEIIVQQQDMQKRASWQMADDVFERAISREDLEEIERTIGTANPLKEKGQLRLLNPVTPRTRAELFMLQDKGNEFALELEEEKKQIQAIDNPEKRAAALQFLEKRQKQLLLGLPGVQDMTVQYNPNPLQMFEDIFNEVAGTLTALVGGYLNPKWISGPIGIVQVIHQHWMLGMKEALFWMAIISLNLGLLNLLPLPVLDGGYIMLSLFEMATGAKLKFHTIEKIIVPFAILLICFLIFLTYHDIIRLLRNLLS